MAQNRAAPRRGLLWHMRIWVGLAIGIVIMFMLLRSVDFAELRGYMHDIKLIPFALSIALFMSSFVFRAFQWKYVLPESQNTHIRHLFTAMMIGFAGNFVLPARAGEFIRAGVLSRREGTPFTTSFASVMATRVLDGLCFICLFVTTLFVLQLDEPLTIPAGSGFLAEPFEISPERLSMAATMIAATFLMAAVCAGATYVMRERVVRLVEFLLKPLSRKLSEWIVHKLATFLDGFTVFGHGGRFARSLGFTAITWAIVILSVYPLILAFPMGVRLPWWTVLVVASLVNLGVMIPLSPGFIGTYHVSVVAALKLSNPAIDYDVAIAFALILHAAQLVLIVLAGVVSLWVENVPLAELKEASVEPELSREPENVEFE